MARRNASFRTRDIQDTRYHTLRRKVGRMHFSKDQGFLYPTVSKKFTTDIENKISQYLMKHFMITDIPLIIGRKEIEEYFLRINPSITTLQEEEANQ